MVGLPLLHGAEHSPFDAMAQAGGTALRLEAREFRAALDANAALRGVLLRHALAFSVQLAWTAACNGRHMVIERLKRDFYIARKSNSALSHDPT